MKAEDRPWEQFQAEMETLYMVGSTVDYGKKAEIKNTWCGVH